MRGNVMRGLRRFTTLALLAASASALAEERWVEPLEGEIWRGGCVGLGAAAFNRELKGVNLGSLTGSQGAAMPLLVSSAGRFVWSERPFAFSLSNGWLRVEGAAEIECVQAGKTLREAYLAASRAHFPFNGKTPPDEFFTKPQFNNWIEMYIRGINQQTVDAYTEEISANRFPCGVYMMDGGWLTHMGSLKFEPDIFPDPRAMFDRIHSKGYKSLVWMVYFVSPDSREYKHLRYHPSTRGQDFLLHRSADRGAAIIRWWSGCSAAWDLTHPMAYGHWLAQLGDFLEEYHIDGFKFDAGDTANFVDCRFREPGQEPCDYVNLYGKLGKHFPYNEYRTGYRQGGKALVMRLHDKGHSWQELRRIIPEMEQAGLLGYPYCVADMIGGGNCGSFPPDGRYTIDQKLFVRSCALQALMPMMQFSLAPWRVLTKENCDICRDFSRLHMKFSSYILEQAKNAAKTGEPILRTMDYEFPNQGFNRPMQQFMLGPRYLVAPVVSSDDSVVVSFPAGSWKDPRGMIVEGPRELKLDNVPLSFLPYFEKQ